MEGNTIQKYVIKYRRKYKNNKYPDDKNTKHRKFINKKNESTKIRK